MTSQTNRSGKWQLGFRFFLKHRTNCVTSLMDELQNKSRKIVRCVTSSHRQRLGDVVVGASSLVSAVRHLGWDHDVIGESISSEESQLVEGQRDQGNDDLKVNWANTFIFDSSKKLERFSSKRFYFWKLHSCTSTISFIYLFVSKSIVIQCFCCEACSASFRLKVNCQIFQLTLNSKAYKWSLLKSW